MVFGLAAPRPRNGFPAVYGFPEPLSHEELRRYPNGAWPEATGAQQSLRKHAPHSTRLGARSSGNKRDREMGWCSDAGGEGSLERAVCFHLLEIDEF